jgi:hypothetical protein
MLRLRLHPMPIITALSRPNLIAEIGSVSFEADVCRQWGMFS